ncbi:hypothetical protein [Amycolatopsis sp. EV170708-02-1]|uniref:hypothetical protein n=1 Tax=Amycolatopsis sp. EV170708-02-1 TaxID=2919322 RepID=UPI001F0C6C3B|nr:hypothetical protein [Amycolatopsis sp. EV170708-02-1]UMP07224.1 hypothetical protein MJQ72_21505 [Amycolatopsis sp. EV170708-02-1]
MLDYSFVLDRLPDTGALHRAISEVFAVDPGGVHVGRLYEDGGGSPATVSCTYIDLDGGEFAWRVDVTTDDTVAGPMEAEVVAALCRRFGTRALLPLDEDSDQLRRLITASEDRVVTIDLDALDENRYVLAE